MTRCGRWLTALTLAAFLGLSGPPAMAAGSSETADLQAQAIAAITSLTPEKVARKRVGTTGVTILATEDASEATHLRRIFSDVNRLAGSPIFRVGDTVVLKNFDDAKATGDPESGVVVMAVNLFDGQYSIFGPVLTRYLDAEFTDRSEEIYKSFETPNHSCWIEARNRDPDQDGPFLIAIDQIFGEPLFVMCSVAMVMRAAGVAVVPDDFDQDMLTAYLSGDPAAPLPVTGRARLALEILYRDAVERGMTAEQIKAAAGD